MGKWDGMLAFRAIKKSDCEHESGKHIPYSAFGPLSPNTGTVARAYFPLQHDMLSLNFLTIIFVLFHLLEAVIGQLCKETIPYWSVRIKISALSELPNCAFGCPYIR